MFRKSEANFLYSIRHVTYNKGKKTPGLDDFVAVQPAQRLGLLERLRSIRTDYDPLPSRRIYVEKPAREGGVTREGPPSRVVIPTVFDRVLQQVYKNALEREWEVLFESSSYGFHPARSVNDAVNRIYVSLNKEYSRKWEIDADIEKCPRFFSFGEKSRRSRRQYHSL